MELEFGRVGFWGERKTAGMSREKEHTRQTTKNSTNKVRRTRDSNPCHNRWSWEPSYQIERTSLQSHCHVTIFFLSQQTAFLQIWQIKTKTKKKKKNDMHDFPVHYCSQEQNGSPYLSSIVRQCKRTSLRRLLRSSNLLQSLLTWLYTFPLCWWRLDFYFTPTGLKQIHGKILAYQSAVSVATVSR